MYSLAAQGRFCLRRGWSVAFTILLWLVESLPLEGPGLCLLVVRLVPIHPPVSVSSRDGLRLYSLAGLSIFLHSIFGWLLCIGLCHIWSAKFGLAVGSDGGKVSAPLFLYLTLVHPLSGEGDAMGSPPGHPRSTWHP